MSIDLLRAETSRRSPAARAALALLALGALAPAVHAQSSTDGAPSFWGLGIGLGYERKAYRDFDDKAQVIPLLMYESRWVSVFGPRIDLKLTSPSSPVSLRLRARYDGDGYEADDSPVLEGMSKRKSGIWMGAAAEWQTSLADLTAEWTADVSGHSKGQRFKLLVERGFTAGSFELTPRIGAAWVDKKYVDYYYGVEADEVRTDRAYYEGKSTLNYEAGLRLGYTFTTNQSMFIDVSATRLGNDIKDSPLVDRSTQTGVRFGYLYRF